MNDPHHTLILWLALGACGPESYVASEPLNPSPDQLLGQLTTAAPFDAGHAPEPPQCEPYTFSGCYWMENHSGAYCWVPSPYSADLEQCFQLDSCDGGLGHSGGGCYKWADCSECARKPWRATPEQRQPPAPRCEPYTFSGCYWMENHSGAYCWVPSPYSADPERCFQLDSCDGGLGHSGGGCYKWADCSDCERQPW